MKYIVKMTIDGSFPGSPDHDYFVVNEKTWSAVRDLVFPFGRFDTLEEAEKESLELNTPEFIVHKGKHQVKEE